jgi:GNAT superfamily N-acetyltransferase
MEDLGIRIGTPEDLDGCMELALMACRENGFVNPNPAKMLEDFWAALNMDNGLVALIGPEGGKIEGGILLRVGTMWYSDEPVLEEKAIFIHPDYRSARGGRARRLCEFAKQAAESLGVPLIIGVLSNQRTEAKIRLYERQFGNPTGAFFLYNARTGLQNEATT